MKRVKCIVAVMLLALVAGFAFAEEPVVFNNAIGFVYTPSTIDWSDDTLCAGLQYQHWFDTVGVSVTGCMYYEENHQFGNYGSYVIAPKVDWKLLAGTQFILCTFDVKNLSWIKDDTVFRLYFWLNGGVGGKTEAPNSNMSAYLYGGTGIGLESVIWKHISIPFELGYQGQFLNKGQFGIVGSAGLRFRF